MKKNFLVFVLIALSLPLLFISCGDKDNDGDIVLSASDFIVYVWGLETEVDIIGGGGGYKVTSSDDIVATATMKSDNSFVVKAISNGIARIVVKDKNNNTATFTITVQGEPPVPISYQYWMNVGDSKLVDIPFEAYGGYTLDNLNKDVAEVVLAENKLEVKALKKGVANVKISDKRGVSSNVIVNVYPENELIVLTTDINLIVETSRTISILNGEDDYQVVSSNTLVALAQIKDRNSVAVTALKAGNSTVTISDSKGRSAVLNITVRD